VVCGVGFESTPYRVANEAGKYCSVKCRGLARQNRVIKTCPVCEKDFETPASIAWTCCSRECATQLRRDDPVEVERVRRMQHDLMVSKVPTKPEEALYRYMDEVFGPEEWFPQAYVLGRWTVDAWVPSLNLVVQADGDWWHGWSEKSRSNATVRANMGRDQGQNHYLEKIGWPYIRLWEHELLRDHDGCIDRLTALRDELSTLADTNDSSDNATS
jgi:very-short-patch-repair endonuclease